MTLERIALGRAVEEQAAEWYRAAGYRVVAQNWRCSDGEIDLVLARQVDRLVVFCEVKARRSARFGSAAAAVGREKQVRLRRLAGRWLAEHRCGAASIRFDVAAWDAGQFEVVEAAF